MKTSTIAYLGLGAVALYFLVLRPKAGGAVTTAGTVGQGGAVVRPRTGLVPGNFFSGVSTTGVSSLSPDGQGVYTQTADSSSFRIHGVTITQAL